ncbi:MAG: TRAP transporter substrate-binding protein DctP [Betaproteobacteria bacterium]|nr:TRAP transporter substrate-binding protein DctP [Betaproteobacteria bacterium]
MKPSLRVMLKSVAAGAIGLSIAGAAVAQAKFQLRWGHYLPDGPFLQLEKDFAANIEKRTNGQVKIDITFAEGLGKGTELLMLTARGGIDMTATAPGYNPDQLRYWRAFQTPLVFNNTKQVIEVLEKVVEEFPVYRGEMDKIGVVWLFQQPLGEYYLSGPSPACAAIADLKGKKARSFGADIPKAFTAIGAVPVTVPPVGVYEAIKTGNLDYSFINPGNIQSLKLNEVAKNHCGPVMAISGHNITISKRTWARLPADIQKIFLEEGKATQQAYMNWVTDFETKAVANIRAQGGNVIPISAPELTKWRAAAPDFLADWEKATAAATGDAETPRKVAARWRELIGK